MSGSRGLLQVASLFLIRVVPEQLFKGVGRGVDGGVAPGQSGFGGYLGKSRGPWGSLGPMGGPWQLPGPFSSCCAMQSCCTCCCTLTCLPQLFINCANRSCPDGSGLPVFPVSVDRPECRFSSFSIFFIFQIFPLLFLPIVANRIFA